MTILLNPMLWRCSSTNLKGSVHASPDFHQLFVRFVNLPTYMPPFWRACPHILRSLHADRRCISTFVNTLDGGGGFDALTVDRAPRSRKFRMPHSAASYCIERRSR